jgi:hypothetical protein
MMFAQANEAIQGAAKITEQASKYGGDVFVVVIVLLIVAAYVILVTVPDARARREQTTSIAKAMELMAPHVVGAHDHAATASANTERMLHALRGLLGVVGKINEAGPKLPIEGDIREIQGGLS